MKQLKESILDADFDIKGVEIYKYDWLKWPCMQGLTGLAAVIHYHNARQYIWANIDIIKSSVSKYIDDANNMVERGYCLDAPRSLFRDFRDFLTASDKSLQSLDKDLQRSYKLDKTQIAMIEVANEIFSDPRLSKVGPKWNEQSFYISVVPKRWGDTLAISNYGDEKEAELVCKVAADACKKYHFECDSRIDTEDGTWDINIHK